MRWQLNINASHKSGSESIGNDTTYYYKVESDIPLEFGALVHWGHVTTYIGGNMSVAFYNHGPDWGDKYLEFGIGYSF